MRSLAARWVLAVAIMAIVSISMATAADTRLLDAAESGDHAAALRLLSQGANANLVGADGSTAVMYAAANDDVELVRALIKAGANVKLKNEFGTSALTE